MNELYSSCESGVHDTIHISRYFKSVINNAFIKFMTIIHISIGILKKETMKKNVHDVVDGICALQDIIDAIHIYQNFVISK
jgi:hypothetical protein